jgi:hypothetical protein
LRAFLMSNGILAASTTLSYCASTASHSCKSKPAQQHDGRC